MWFAGLNTVVSLLILVLLQSAVGDGITNMPSATNVEVNAVDDSNGNETSNEIVAESHKDVEVIVSAHEVITNDQYQSPTLVSDDYD